MKILLVLISPRTRPAIRQLRPGSRLDPSGGVLLRRYRSCPATTSGRQGALPCATPQPSSFPEEAYDTGAHDEADTGAVPPTVPTIVTSGLRPCPKTIVAPHGSQSSRTPVGPRPLFECLWNRSSSNEQTIVRSLQREPRPLDGKAASLDRKRPGVQRPEHSGKGPETGKVPSRLWLRDQ